jgi:membrane protein implicated in regulation of membrane protease activity
MWFWLILAGILLAVEITTGTLALLFAGAGAAVAALLAYFAPESLALQICVFALSTVIGAIVAWQRLKRQRSADADKGTEFGQEVEVATLPDAGGHLRVRYRGSEWPARLANRDLTVETRQHLRVVAQEGSLLVVDINKNEER